MNYNQLQNDISRVHHAKRLPPCPTRFENAHSVPDLIHTMLETSRA